MRSKNIVYNVVTNIILQVVILIYGFIVPKIIFSNYGSNVNGLISSIGQFLAYITLLESGVGPVIKASLYKPLAKKDKKTIINILAASDRFFKLISLIFVGYIVIMCIFYPMAVINEFNYGYTVSLIIIISISTFATYFFGMTYGLFLQADQKVYITSIIQTIIYILCVIIIIIMAKLNFSIQIIKLTSGLIFVIRPLIQNIYVKKKYNINLKTADKKYKLKNKWDGLSQHIAYVIHTNTDVTILTLFTSLIEVSIYSVYSLITRGIKSIIQAFTSGFDSIFGDMLANNETNNLKRKFNVYETIYYSLTTIIYTSTIVLIIPFIKVYTSGVKDANYIRPLFSTLIVIAEYIWAIRAPYNSIIQAAGHFKETRKGAWVEAIVNLALSIFLVFKFGLVGVAIGTLVSILIRTIEFIYHCNKYIIKRSIFDSVKKVFIVAIESLIIILICNYTFIIKNTSYLNWLINACVVFITSVFITISINYIFFKNDFKQISILLKNFISKKRKKV